MKKFISAWNDFFTLDEEYVAECVYVLILVLTDAVMLSRPYCRPYVHYSMPAAPAAHTSSTTSCQYLCLCSVLSCDDVLLCAPYCGLFCRLRCTTNLSQRQYVCFNQNWNYTSRSTPTGSNTRSYPCETLAHTLFRTQRPAATSRMYALRDRACCCFCETGVLGSFNLILGSGLDFCRCVFVSFGATDKAS